MYFAETKSNYYGVSSQVDTENGVTMGMVRGIREDIEPETIKVGIMQRIIK